MTLHSAPEGKHLSFLGQHPNVCITFCTERKLIYQHPDVACSYSMCSSSVLAHGKVEFVEELNQKTEILNIIMKQYSGKTFQYSEPAVRNVKIWKVKPESITCKEFGVSAKR